MAHRESESDTVVSAAASSGRAQAALFQASGMFAGLLTVIVASAPADGGEPVPRGKPSHGLQATIQNGSTAKGLKYTDWSQVAAKVSADLHRRDLLKWSDELAGQLATSDMETLLVAVEVFRRAGQPERVSQAVLKLGKSPAAGRAVMGPSSNGCSNWAGMSKLARGLIRSRRNVQARAACVGLCDG